MAAPIGNKFSPGRGKGIKGKKTIQWEVFSAYCLNGGLQKFKKELTALKGREFVESFIKLLEFHKPKLARTELTDKDGAKLFPEINVKFDNGNNGKSTPKV